MDICEQRTGGRGGIRTHDTGLPHTRFPSVRLQPLGHPSAAADNAQGGAEMQRRISVGDAIAGPERNIRTGLFLRLPAY